MAESPRSPGKAGESSDVGAVRSSGRRRLLQAGVSTAPVLMTVLSRPVLAQAGNCQSPSGFVSGNASNPGMATCLGNAPEQWADPSSTWPAPYQDKTTLFKDVFTPDLNPADKKFLDVLNTGATNGALGVARLCVAAALNIADNRIPPTVLTLAAVKHIWTEYATTGVYHPTLSATWNEAEIIEYLQTTMNTPG